MATWYAIPNNGWPHWDDNDGNGNSTLWNSAPDGSGSWATPAPGSGDTCDLNGHTVNVDSGVSVGGSLLVVDGSGGGGWLQFDSPLTSTDQWNCYCNLAFLGSGNPTVLMSLVMNYVNSSCGQLNIDTGASLQIGTASASGTFDANVPINIGAQTQLILQQGTYPATCVFSSFPVAVAGKLCVPATALASINFGPIWFPGPFEIVALDASGNPLHMTGTFTLPPVGKIASGTNRGDGELGTRTDCPAALAVTGQSFGDPDSPILGTYPTTAATQAADAAAVAAAAAGITTATTILGVAGTLDMSAYTLISGVVGPTYVLSGHDNYSGGSTGSLTLPAAGDVLSGSGTYGVAGTGSTPTLTLPAAGDVLSGTRTDCPAADALSGTSYGAGGTSITGTMFVPTTAAIATAVAAAILTTPANKLATDGSGEVTFNNTAIDNVTTLTNLPAITSGWLTAAGIAAGALDGKGDWLAATSYTAPDNSTIGEIYLVVGSGVYGNAAIKTAVGSPQQVGSKYAVSWSWSDVSGTQPSFVASNMVSLAGIALSTDVATAVSDLETFGQSNWQTATGFLTSLGATAPAGWINQAAFATGVLPANFGSLVLTEGQAVAASGSTAPTVAQIAAAILSDPAAPIQVDAQGFVCFLYNPQPQLVYTMPANLACSRADVENVFGAENVQKWADVDNCGDPTVIARRIDWSIAWATNELQDMLRDGPYVVDPLPATAAATWVPLAAMLAGWMLSNPRVGEDTVDPAVQRKNSWALKLVQQTVHQIKTGQRRINAVPARRMANVPLVMP